MAAFDRVPVVVRQDASGTICIDSVGATALPTGVSTDGDGSVHLIERLPVQGAEIMVDLARLDAAGYHEVPSAIVYDSHQALWWLEFLYGEAIADAVREVADPGDADEVEVAADEIQAGFLANAVLRFATGLWLLRWWPSHDARLSDGETALGITLSEEAERWLRTELGSLAWYAEHVFGGRDVARILLSEQRPTVLRLTAAADTPRHLALVRAFIESVYDPEVAELEAREQEIVVALNQEQANRDATAARTAAEASLSNSRDKTFGPHVVSWRDVPPEPEAATKAPRPQRNTVTNRGGFLGSGRFTGADTVAWGRVQARLLTADEKNIAWTVTVSPLGGATLAVSVGVGDRPRPDVPIFAVVYLGDVVDQVIEFAPAKAARVLLAATTLESFEDGDQLRIVVYDESDLDPARPEPALRPEERAMIADKVRTLIQPLPPEPADLDQLAAYDLDPSLPWPVPVADLGGEGE